MPVYLCQPGAGATEPWRHGIQVYATPFALDETAPVSTGVGRDMVVLPVTSNESAHWSNEQRREQQPHGQQPQTVGEATSSAAGQIQQHRQRMGVPIRRVRHAEVVLVDDVCVAYERYWLRLRWPGHSGGFAGYIALGRVGQTSLFRRTNPSTGGM